MRRGFRIAAAHGLILIGISQMIGCFFIPASRQKIAGTNKPRPDTHFKRATTQPLKIKEATLEDFLLLTRQPIDWQSTSGQFVVVEFQVDRGTVVWPLCLVSYETGSEPRYLVMGLDDTRHITSWKTYRDLRQAADRLGVEFVRYQAPPLEK